MKKTYIEPEVSVIDVEIEALLQVISSGDSLGDTSWGGDDDSGLDAEGKVYDVNNFDVWD